VLPFSSASPSSPSFLLLLPLALVGIFRRTCVSFFRSLGGFSFFFFSRSVAIFRVLVREVVVRLW
jgi:ABC-type molybdate transport system permease subunit